MPFLLPNQQRQSTEGTVLANNNKSAVLCLGKNEGKQSYQIKQANVSFISAMRDLGIITDNKLTVSQHWAHFHHCQRSMGKSQPNFQMLSNQRSEYITQSIHNLFQDT